MTMPHATLSAPTVDVYGVVQLPLLPSQAPDPLRRRSSRIATLDGGAVLNDSGYSDADREIVLRWAADARLDAVVAYLVRFYARLVLSQHDGCYLCAPGAFQARDRGDQSRLTLHPLSRLSA